MMKWFKLKALLVLLAMLLLQCHLKAETVLVVELTTGQTESFALSDKPKLTVSEAMLKIKSTTVEMDFDRSRIVKFYFVDDATAVKEIEDKATVSYRQSATNQLTVQGLTDRDGIVVSDMAGHVYTDCIERNAESAIVDLNRCPNGIYIIKIGNKQTIKMIKR